MQRYWVLAANPKNYRIEDAVKELDHDSWTIRDSDISKGDLVAIWKTQGDSNNRGIICFGEVISDVKTGSDEKKSYWINSELAQQVSRRVLVRYIHAPGLPLWVGGRANDLLQSLSVSRSQGGTVFKITPEQWDLILDAVGGWPEGSSKESSYWWVNHKQTVTSEIEGGYIWSPKINRNGASNQTYNNLTLTKARDIVFSYANTKISAVGVVTGSHTTQKRPSEFGRVGDSWASSGWMVPIEWHRLENPLSPKSYIKKISPLLPERNSPLQSNGNGNQGCYLASISDELGDFILSLIKNDEFLSIDSVTDLVDKVEADKEEVAIKNSPEIAETEKSQLILARKGQGKFKSNVKKIESACRLTKISDKSFLIASHIKPWKNSTNAERLDGNNGLLLSPHVDTLFDKGWISFTDDGDVICNDIKVLAVMKAWGLRSDMNVGHFSNAQCQYLKYHREIVYQKRNKQ